MKQRSWTFQTKVFGKQEVLKAKLNNVKTNLQKYWPKTKQPLDQITLTYVYNIIKIRKLKIYKYQNKHAKVLYDK